MKNPGLSVFAGVVTSYIKSRNHPLNIDPIEDDPELAENDDNASDYVPPVNFGRWRSPGQSIRVPFRVGPPYQPGESPDDVFYGELLSPVEKDGADKIINGEHESSHPSANPYVEHAREDLHTPESSVAVDTLSGLLRGAHPNTMSPESMDAAHEYLSRHFTGVRVNPHHGTLMAASPAGMQMVRRHANLPAISDHQTEEPSYSLTNKHGTFESQDPQRLVRAMLAFQIVHNEVAAQRQKKNDDDQDDDGLNTTSSIRDFIGDMADKARDVAHYLRPSPGLYNERRPNPLGSRPPTSRSEIPHEAVFEPGAGTDANDLGVRGGWVAHDAEAPAHWERDKTGVAYSPGHEMNAMLNRHQSLDPREDPYFPGHTFTYASNPYTGHTIERHGGGSRYFVTRLHPAARGGIDIPPRSRPTVASVRPHSIHGSVQTNDLCPVCASGYLEPYDNDTHECLNCGSLVKHIGFDKEAATEASRRSPRGGLGRGLNQIMEYKGDPLNLESGGSDNPDNIVDLDETMAHHPLADVEPDPDFDSYQAPVKTLLDKKAGEADPLDEHLGKFQFFPIHKPGHSRIYVKPDPDIEGSYYRLTEGARNAAGQPSGWALSADHIPGREPWTQHGEPYADRHITVERRVKSPGATKSFKQPLRDPGERPMGGKSMLAAGTHPIDDYHLNRAIRDVSEHGRNSKTYQDAFMNTAYEPPKLPVPRSGTSQRDLRLLSSVDNPGLSRFTSVS